MQCWRATLFNARGGRPSVMRRGCIVIAVLSLWLGGSGASFVASNAEWCESGSCEVELLSDAEIRRVVPHRARVHEEGCESQVLGRPGSETRNSIGRNRTLGRPFAWHLIGSGIYLRC